MSKYNIMLIPQIGEEHGDNSCIFMYIHVYILLRKREEGTPALLCARGIVVCWTVIVLNTESKGEGDLPL